MRMLNADSLKNHPTNEPAVTTVIQMMRRRRNSSRCSTIVISLGSGSLIARKLRTTEAISLPLSSFRGRVLPQRCHQGAAAAGGGALALALSHHGGHAAGAHLS